MESGNAAIPIARPVAPAGPWAEHVFTVGTTGTNGKTSTTLLVAEVLRSSGAMVAAETTIGATREPGVFTPRSESKFLDRMRDLAERGYSRLAIEVTSEALASGWAKKWRFDLGIFTNLTQDHLDAHRTFEHYLASKAQLFVHLGPGCHAVLNAADPASMLLQQVIPQDVSQLWYGSPLRGPFLAKPDLAVSELTISLDGTRVVLAPSEFAEQLGGSLHTQLIGGVFAENALAAACAGLALKLEPKKVAEGIARLQRVPGRFEVVTREPAVIVDYAHTPDALVRTCSAARTLTQNLGGSRLIVVFGAGGNRDPNKRGPMGEAVGQIADIAIITNDNPRKEDPQLIARAIEAGCRQSGRSEVVVELDRHRAIEQAIDRARLCDVIVICGKGHEIGQEVGSETLPFDDAEVARIIVQGSHTRRSHTQSV